MSEEKKKSSARPASADSDSLRPSGKRQVTGAASSRAVSRQHQAPEVVKSRSNPVEYFRGVGQELRKVIWPTGREMVTYTIVVLSFLVILTALVAGVDYLTTLGVRFMFNVK